MERHGYRVGTGDWATHHCHHGRLRGNHIFVPTPVDSSLTGECGLFSKHHDGFVLVRQKIIMQHLYSAYWDTEAHTAVVYVKAISW